MAGGVRVVEAETGAARHHLPGHAGGATSVAWADEGTVASAGQDGRVRLWDARTGSERLALDAGARWVARVAASPCRTYLAAAAGKKVRIWDRDGWVLHDYPAHASTVTDLAWRPGVAEASASAYGGVTQWSPDSPEPAGRFEWKGSVLRLAWSPDGRFLATGDQDATVHFWVVGTNADLKMWGYRKKVTQLAWDHSSRYLATNGGHRVTVWDCSGAGPEGTRPILLDSPDDTAAVTALGFQPRGPLLGSGGSDGRVVLWRPRDGHRPLAEARFDSAITQIAWHDDGARLCVGTDHGAVVALRVG
jgi:WD40 repeat protein